MIASTIIQSSILVLAILLIRKIFKERISAQMLYRLWGLVVLRLLWPVVALYGHIIGLNLPKSEISIMNIFEAVKDGVLSTHPAAYFVIDNITLGHVYTSDTGLVGLGLAGFMAEEQGIGANFGWIQNLAASKMPFLAGLDLQLLFGIIWIVGAVCVCMWFHHINSKFINRLVDDRNELILDAETIDEISGIISDKIKLSQRSVIKLYSVDNLSTPCIVSIKGEVGIYIPTKIVSDKRKLTYAIIHEMCHYQQNDLKWTRLRIAILAVYWFNPFVWLASIYSKRDSELSCDDKVIRLVGEDRRIDYGKALIELITDNESEPFMHTTVYTATTMYSGTKDVKERITMITSRKTKNIFALIMVLCLAVVAAGCTFTSAVNEVNDETITIEGEGGSQNATGTAIDITNKEGNITIEEGQSLICYPVSEPFSITSEFGERTHPITGEKMIHSGVDLTSENDEVYAIGNGFFNGYGYDEEDGNWIELIWHPYGMEDEEGINTKLYVYYCHLESSVLSNLKEDELLRCGNVFAGDVIGTMGSTGKSTGKHLHFEIRTESGNPNSAIDPMEILGL